MGAVRTILWRRLDRPGHESCRVSRAEDARRLEGSAVFDHERRPSRLDYVIVCDAMWETRSARVTGWVGDTAIQVDIAANPNRTWRLDGRECPAASGCVDVDLNFSPSTNLLPIRRLGLSVGGTAEVRAAWLRFPSFALEPLEQRYTRLGETTFRYESAGGTFVREIEVNDAGLVTRYPDFWEAVATR